MDSASALHHQMLDSRGAPASKDIFVLSLTPAEGHMRKQCVRNKAYRIGCHNCETFRPCKLKIKADKHKFVAGDLSVNLLCQVRHIRDQKNSLKAHC